MTCVSVSKGLAALLLVAALSALAHAEGWRERFIDPQDGAFDVSDYLLDHRGALAALVHAIDHERLGELARGE